MQQMGFFPSNTDCFLGFHSQSPGSAPTVASSVVCLVVQLFSTSHLLILSLILMLSLLLCASLPRMRGPRQALLSAHGGAAAFPGGISELIPPSFPSQSQFSPKSEH